jgi:hypothetical protein
VGRPGDARVTRFAHSLSVQPDRPTAHDVIVVLRLWTEAHDPRPRARLLRGEGEPGEPLMGTTAILEALERVVRSFELEARSGHGEHADETRVQRPR